MMPIGTSYQAAWSDVLVRGIYRRRIEQIRNLYGLAAPSAIPVLAPYRGAESGICAAATPDFTLPDASTSVVVGGGCLSYTSGRADLLRADYLADTVLALALAAWASCRCVIYIPVGEELAVTDRGSHDAWRRFGDVMQRFVRLLSNRLVLGHPVRIVRTDRPSTSDLLEHSAERWRAETSEQDLAYLYNICGPQRDSDRPAGPRRLHQYRRTIVTYLPQTLRTLIDDARVDHVVVAENLHQVRAIAAAQRIVAAGSSTDRIDYLAHLPTPSITATKRMAHAADRSAIGLLESPSAITTKTARMSPTAFQFWYALAGTLGGFTGQNNVDLVEMLGDARRLLLTACAATSSSDLEDEPK